MKIGPNQYRYFIRLHGSTVEIKTITFFFRMSDSLDFSNAKTFVLTEHGCSQKVHGLSGRAATRCLNHICVLVLPLYPPAHSIRVAPFPWK
jgi:hypothetical protein